MKKVLNNPILIGLLLITEFVLLVLVIIHILSYLCTNSWNIDISLNIGSAIIGGILGIFACIFHFTEPYDGSGPENKENTHPSNYS